MGFETGCARKAVILWVLQEIYTCLLWYVSFRRGSVLEIFVTEDFLLHGNSKNSSLTNVFVQE